MIRVNGYFGELEIDLPCGVYWSPDVINWFWRLSLQATTKRHVTESIERLLTPCNGLCTMRKHGRDE